jgi:glycosyltransferase involved in cell wall biosynthesis
MEYQLRDMMQNLGIQDNIILRTEFVSEPERIQHFAAADIVVLPSLYEPFGIVCTEAMALEKPVVIGARGTNGMREQIIPQGDMRCGIHINPFNPEDIAWGVKQILQLEDKGEAMGKNGRQRVIDEFSWDTIAQRTLDIYQEFQK